MAKKTYSREFKLKVVQTVEAGELRPAQACREYQIAESVLTRWRQEVRLRGAEAAFTPLLGPSATPDYEARIAELERVCGQLAVENAALKKRCSGSSPGPTSAHDNPAAGVPQLVLSVRQLCDLLSVSRSWFYARPHTPTQAERDLALRDAIERIVLEFPGYGYRRVTAELHRQQWEVNHKRVLRIMRAEALLCQLERNWVTTTDSRHGLRTYPNLLAGLILTGPNQAWVGDITYVRLPSCFIYLACILDGWSRRCVGWQLSRTIDTQLTLAALNHAITLRRPEPGLIHHSDRGVQYASSAYIERLSEVGAQVSLSAKGNPYDNAKAESFFKTLKREEVYLNQYESFTDAEAQLGRFIDGRVQSEAASLEPRLSAARRVRKPLQRPREAPLSGGPVGWVQSNAYAILSVMRDGTACRAKRLDESTPPIGLQTRVVI